MDEKGEIMWHEILNRLAPGLSVLEKHQGGCMVLLTIALCVCAAVSCLIAMKSVSLMKRLDAKRSNPYVIIEATQHIPFYGVRLVNLGLTAARNVKVEVSPKLEIVLENWHKPIRFLEEGVAVLVPNGAYATDWGTWKNLEKDNPSLVYRCTVHYESEWGEKLSTECVVDYTLYDGLLYSSKKTMTDLVKQFETFSRDFNHFATGFHKLHVLTEEYEKYNEKRKRRFEACRAALATRDSSAVQQPVGKEGQCESDEKGVQQV